jgi:Na+-transporting NADH:ubiquinone oxidoreductase subunit NqrD
MGLRNRFQWFGTTLAGHIAVFGVGCGTVFFLSFLQKLSTQQGALADGRWFRLLVLSIAAFSIPGIIIWFTLSKPAIERRKKDNSNPKQ